MELYDQTGENVNLILREPLAALEVYTALISEGTQRRVIDRMQTREQLYDFLDYDRYAKELENDGDHIR